MQTALELLPHTQISLLKKGDLLEKQGQAVKYQFIVKSGVVRKYLSDSEGNEFTTGFFLTNQAITPILLRSNDFISFVNLEVISPAAEILCFSFQGMQQTMERNLDLQQYGYRVMMQEAFMMAEREKILLTANGIERLEWFRQNYPNLENEVPHYHIASFLGMTPTSLSRTRRLMAK